MKLKQTLGLLLCIAITSTLNAQVTIGSSEKPNAGALLDLKNLSGGTANKGLMLPRVQLTDIDKLKPMYSYANAANTPAQTDLDNHTGLMVYATDNFGSPSVNCPGLYVWDGGEWQALSPPTESMPDDITMTDNDGNVYNAKWFGDPCDLTVGAYWTTSNLYTTKNRSNAAFSGGVILNPATSATIGAYVVINSVANLNTGTIPNYGVDANKTVSAAKGITGQSRRDFAKEYGLSYNWAQAQVACPTGWHLPTRQDWDNLISAVGSASLRKASTWKYYYTAADAYSSGNQWGEKDGNTTPVFSGFDAVPSGKGPDLGNQYVSYSFSNGVEWWANNNGTGERVDMGYTLISPSFYPTYGSTTSYYMMRCVQD